MTSTTACGPALFELEICATFRFLGDLVREIEQRASGSRALAPVHELGRRRHHPLRRGCDHRIPPPARGAERRTAPPTSRCVAAAVRFSDAMAEADRAVKAFLFPHMYRHPRVMKSAPRRRRIVRALFERFRRSRGAHARGMARAARPSTARRAMAGAADHLRLYRRNDRPLRAQEHRRLFGWAPELR